jgi:hypothetical protein
VGSRSPDGWDDQIPRWAGGRRRRRRRRRREREGFILIE